MAVERADAGPLDTVDAQELADRTVLTSCPEARPTNMRPSGPTMVAVEIFWFNGSENSSETIAGATASRLPGSGSEEMTTA